MALQDGLARTLDLEEKILPSPKADDGQESTNNDCQQSRLILESVKGTPVELSDLFINSQWSMGGKIVCSGFLVLGLATFILTVVALINGAVKSLNYISERDRLLKTGLFMVPNIIDNDGDAILAFNLNDPKGNTQIEAYVQEINGFLTNFKETCQRTKPYSKTDCDLEKKFGNTDCTQESHYGFYKGEPCIIIGLRNIGFWKPIVDSYFMDGLKYSYRYSWDFKLTVRHPDPSYVPINCQNKTSSYTSQYTYSFNESNVLEHDAFGYFPESGLPKDFLSTSGENDLGPIMFVQLKNLTMQKWSRFECQILASNTDQFKGVKSLLFDYRYSKEFRPEKSERYNI